MLPRKLRGLRRGLMLNGFELGGGRGVEGTHVPALALSLRLSRTLLAANCFLALPGDS